MASGVGASGGGPGLSDAELNRELDILLAPLSRQLRYPLPVPKHLATSTEGMDAVTSASPSSTARALSQPPKRLDEGRGKKADALSLGPASGSEKERQDRMTRALRQQALRYCAAKVEGLQRWQDRVEEGLLRGLDSQRVLEHVLAGVTSMRSITTSVQEQSNTLSHSASVLMSRKLRLVQVQEELQRTIQHFTHMEDLCREADDAMITVQSPRFPQLFQDLESEMQFLSRNAQFKSAKVYATKLAVAQQKTTTRLMNAIKVSFTTALKQTNDAMKLHFSGRSTAVAALPAPPTPSSATIPQGDTPSSPPAPQDAVSTGPEEPRPLSQSQVSSPTYDAPGVLDASNPIDKFAETLRLLNDTFLDKVGTKASLRRMAELRSSFSYTGAEAFGEVPVSSLEDDPMLLDVLRYYCETRVGLVGPLLKDWLAAWCRADAAMQHQQQLQQQQQRTVPQLPTTEASSTKEEPTSPAATPVRGTSSAPGDSLRLDGGVGGSSLGASVHNSPLTGLAAAVGPQTQLPLLAEHMCALLEVTLQEERQVLDAVWLRSDFAAYMFPKLVGDIAEEVYHAFRARLVRVDALEELAATVEQIQVVNLRQASDASVVQELSRLWVRMIQDVQERMHYRTSVCLRQDVGRGRPTRQLVQQYTDIITAGVAPSGNLPLIPGVESAVYLLNLLYPTLEFSVFSEFAEEAVEISLRLIDELARMLLSQTAMAPWTEVMSVGAQLMHLLYLRTELARIDANITVVEKSLDFAKLAKDYRFHIKQSSRDSKTIVEGRVQACSTRLSQALCEVVARPLTGAQRMTAAAVAEKMKVMEDAAAKGKYLVFVLLHQQHAQTQEALALAVDRRVAELTHEVAEMNMSAQSGEAPSPSGPT